MGTVNFLLNLTKNYFTFGLIGLTVSDRYASIVPVGGISMSPTFNPHDDSSMRSLTRNYCFSSLLHSLCFLLWIKMKTSALVVVVQVTLL